MKFVHDTRKGKGEYRKNKTIHLWCRKIILGHFFTWHKILSYLLGCFSISVLVKVRLSLLVPNWKTPSLRGLMLAFPWSSNVSCNYFPSLPGKYLPSRSHTRRGKELRPPPTCKICSNNYTHGDIIYTISGSTKAIPGTATCSKTSYHNICKDWTW